MGCPIGQRCAPLTLIPKHTLPLPILPAVGTRTRTDDYDATADVQHPSGAPPSLNLRKMWGLKTSGNNSSHEAKDGIQQLGASVQPGFPLLKPS